jgi:hypothetical protein
MKEKDAGTSEGLRELLDKLCSTFATMSLDCDIFAATNSAKLVFVLFQFN